MYREFILLGFAAFTAALPLDKSSDDSIHQASYHPYYSYGPYPSAVEAEAAKMQHETETTSLKRDTVQAGDESYGNYGIYYIAYEPYPSAVEAEAAKMDMVKRGYKRHMMSMPKEVMDKIASSSEKRDIHNEVQAAGDTWYERYDPYSAYGDYSGETEAEAEAAKME